MPRTRRGTPPNARHDRNRDIVARAAAGESKTAIGRDYGITPQRVCQIVAEARYRSLPKRRNPLCRNR